MKLDLSTWVFSRTFRDGFVGSNRNWATSYLDWVLRLKRGAR
jgi:hypothetical protein